MEINSSNNNNGERCLWVLCRKIITIREPGIHWLIGSPFLQPFTIVSSIRCLHTQSNNPFSPDYPKESDDLRALLLRGFDVVGALFVGDGNWEETATNAAECSREIKKLLFSDYGNLDMIGAAGDLTTGNIHFFISRPRKPRDLESFATVTYEDCPEKSMWENGCLLRCELPIKLPVYVPINKESDANEIFSSVIDEVSSKFRGPQAAYMVEGVNVTSEEVIQPIVLRYAELDFQTDLTHVKLLKTSSIVSEAKTLPCSYFCSKDKLLSSFTARESADAIQVYVFLNQSRNTPNSAAPIAEYFPASEPAQLVVISFKLKVLCYASMDLPVASAISKLIVPGLANQLTAMKKAIMPSLLTKHPQLIPYHFFPPGILHPITAIYDLSYGETELKQAEIRRCLHLRLGLPMDRPLLLIANALNFGITKDTAGSNSMKNGSALLKDVHTGIPSSGVSGGLTSLVEGSYEYFHYLQDGFDDSGWGCAYRSLQTIISWFRLQHYTSVKVPSHREIQQALVEIGDKEPSFMGSREWIGAIELSFVLDKLLGVSCKIINVRSGAELPEKCRELALHFETQGTPVMIGGGVLAYTLLGVDYNDVSGDCAFLILDPHYTGGDEIKRIVSGGWCGWKKAVDSRGKSFFLHDMFYNLLLPQRPNMV